MSRCTFYDRIGPIEKSAPAPLERPGDWQNLRERRCVMMLPYPPSRENHFETRLCTRCRKIFPATIEYFQRKGDGFNSRCRTCLNELKRERYRTHGRPDRPTPSRRWFTQVWTVSGNVASLVLTTGDVVIADADDIGKLSSISWFKQTAGYAAGRKQVNGKRPIILMHRFVLDAKPGSEVDHINGNKLDNRKANLRFVTRSQNRQNQQGARKDSKTGVRNVIYDERKRRFKVVLSIDGKVRYFGSFESLEEAEAAAKEARRKYFTHAPESEHR